MRDAASRIVLLVALVASALAGCTELFRQSRNEPQIWDVGAGRFISEDALVARLAAARYRLLGEMHDNPEHHRLRAALIRRIAVTGRTPAVVFEQLELDRADALVAAQADGRGADAEAIATAGGLERSAWQWPLHKPLIDAALAAHLPIRAGNPSRNELMRAARAIGDTVPDAPWGERFSSARWTAAQDAVMRNDIVEGHCGKLPEHALQPIIRAQRMRDAALAQALVDAATADGAILIAGNGHVRRDLAVPAYLKPLDDRAADTTVLSVGFIEATPADRQASDFPRDFLGTRADYDIVWFTAATSRSDPCLQMPAMRDRSS